MPKMEELVNNFNFKNSNKKSGKNQMNNKVENKVYIPTIDNFDEKLISDKIENFAKFIFKNATRIDSGKKKVKKEEYDSYTQIRKFYDELKRIEINFNVEFNKKQKESNKSSNENNKYSKDELFKERYINLIKIMKAKAAYSKGRNKISEEFKNFLDRNINLINDINSFNNFIILFESFIGYYKFYYSIDNKNDYSKYIQNS